MSPDETPVSSMSLPPKIYVSRRIYDTLTLMTSKNSLEWTMFGKTERREDGNFQLVSFKVPKQINGGSSTEVEEEDMMDMVGELIEAGENPKDWNVWLHSHHTMGCFWSGTDLAQINGFEKLKVKFFLSIVCSSNWSREHSLEKRDGACLFANLAVFDPFRLDYKIEIVVEGEERFEEYYDILQQALTANEKKRFPTYSQGGYQGYNPNGQKHLSYYGDDDDDYLGWGKKNKKRRNKYPPVQRKFFNGAQKKAIAHTLRALGLYNMDKNAQILEDLEILEFEQELIWNEQEKANYVLPDINFTSLAAEYYGMETSELDAKITLLFVDFLKK